MAKKYVYSTLASDQIYNVFPESEPDGIAIPAASVKVLGGAGVAGDWKRLHTPRGVATPVTDEQIAILRQNKTFALHEKNGYVCIEEGNFDADDVASTMSETDPSRPLTEETLQAAVPDANIVVNGAPVAEVTEAPKGKK